MDKDSVLCNNSSFCWPQCPWSKASFQDAECNIWNSTFFFLWKIELEWQRMCPSFMRQWTDCLSAASHRSRLSGSKNELEPAWHGQPSEMPHSALSRNSHCRNRWGSGAAGGLVDCPGVSFLLLDFYLHLWYELKAFMLVLQVGLF